MTTTVQLAGLTRTLDDVIATLNQRVARTQPTEQRDRLDAFAFDFTGADAVATRRADGQRLTLNRRALTQFLARLQVPVKFFDRLPEDLKWANVHHFLANGAYEREVTLRKVHGDVVRAVVSDRYAPLDDDMIFPHVKNALAGHNVRVQFADIYDGDYTHVRLVFDHTAEEVRPGDLVCKGLHITNSEVGLRSVRVEPFLYRVRNQTGIVAPEILFRTTARHVGDPARLDAQIRNAITVGIAEADKMFDMLKRAAVVTVADPEKVIKNHAEAQKMNDDQIKLVLGAFQAGLDPTLLGMIDAFVTAAATIKNTEDRYTMERVGGRLLAKA